MPITPISDDILEKTAEDFLAAKAQGHYDGISLRIEPLIEAVGFTIFPIKGLAEIAEAYLPLSLLIFLWTRINIWPEDRLAYDLR